MINLQSILTALLSLAFCPAVTQNLVPNGSFELLKSEQCVMERPMNGVTCLLDWKAAKGLPDYVNHRIQPDNVRAPSAKDGVAMVGLYLSYPGNPPSLEYLEVRLSDSLDTGANYRIELYVAKDLKHYPKAVEGLGVYLSETPLSQVLEQAGTDKQLQMLRIIDPQLIQADSQKLVLKNKWKRLATDYVARGGEKYLSIGLFHFDDTDLTDFIYCYIDAVSVQRSGTVGSEIMATELSRDGTVILKNIYFDSGSPSLKSESMNNLELLVNMLRDHPELKIEIIGHTDNTGDEEDNKLLSMNRAKSVVDYLISKGIDKSRLRYQGMGSTVPVTTNDDEAGRAMNRRIEVRISK